MMSLAVVIKYVLLAWCMPYVLGIKLTRAVGGEEARPLHCVFHGYLVMWAVMQLVAIPMIFLRRGFHELVYLCLGVFALLMLWTIVTDFSWSLGQWRTYPALWKKQGIIQSGLLLLIVVQAAYVSLGYLVNDDDAYYVATAQTSLDTDSMYVVDPYTGNDFSSFPARYVLSPFPMFVAFMSRLIGVKAPGFAHTLLPFVLLIFAFFIYYMWAQKLFQNQRAGQNCFLFLSMVILAFSNFSTHARGMMTFSRIWQGKAVLASVLLPFLLLLGVKMLTESYEKRDWILLLVVMLSSCLVSSMGIILAAIEIGIFGLLASLHHKRWREILFTIICCLPNVIYAGIYVLIR